MAVKASNQMTLIDLTDAYTIVLTNEAHTFIGGTSSVASTQTATTQIFAYQGNDQVPVTVGEITGATGISATSDGKTPAPTVTITATSALATGGVLKLPLTVNGDIQITKEFSYAIAFKGQTGSTGATGNGIKSSAVTYQVGTSGTSAPTGTWSTTPVATTAAGQFLWTRTITTFTDGSSSTSYAVAAHGAKGDTGSKGATGNGIKSTVVTYQVGTSGTSAPTGTWSSTPVATTAAGQYLWTKTVITYTDGTSSASYSVAAHGKKGDTGATGAPGADALTVVVTSSAGTIFKNADIATTLTAHVYKAGAEVTGTALSALGTIKWYKDGGTTAVATGQSLTISAGSVSNKASYVAQLEG